MYWVETQQSKQISCLAETIRNAYFKYWKENYLGDITKPFLFNWIKPASFDVGRWSTRQGTLVEEAIFFPHPFLSLSLSSKESLPEAFMGKALMIWVLICFSMNLECRCCYLLLWPSVAIDAML